MAKKTRSSEYVTVATQPFHGLGPGGSGHKTQEPEEVSFDQKMHEIVQRTLIDFIAKGDWLKIDYSARVPVDLSLLRRIHDSVDMGRVVSLVKERVEEKMADTIMHSMAQEITNDVKSIMSNRELREDVRGTIRTKIRQVHSAMSE